MGIFSGIRDYLKKISSKETELPDIIFIPPSNTDEEKDLSTLFEAGKHYFTVRVNELFLTQQMQWFKKYEPVVLAFTEFSYDGKTIEHPYVVGCNMLDEKMKKIPQGMLFHDTRVAGIHPFKGSKIVTTIVLCQALRGDLLKDAINFIGKVSDIFSKNISKLLGSYLSAAGTVLDGLDALFKRDDLIPVMGYRKEFDVDANDKVKPGYFVLLNKSLDEFDEKKFFIKGKRLHYGDNKDTAVEFRELEFVLFSLTQTDKRTDYESLPFYETYKEILRDVRDKVKEKQITQELKDEVVNRITALSFDMELSPDLTSTQAEILSDYFFEEIKKIISKEYKWAASKGKKVDTYWTIYREKVRAL